MNELFEAIAAGRFEDARPLAGEIPPQPEALPELRRALKLARIGRARISADLRRLPRVYRGQPASLPQRTWTG